MLRYNIHILIIALLLTAIAPFYGSLDLPEEGIGGRILICTADGLKLIDPNNPDDDSDVPGIPRCPMCVLGSHSDASTAPQSIATITYEPVSRDVAHSIVLEDEAVALFSYNNHAPRAPPVFD